MCAERGRDWSDRSALTALCTTITPGSIWQLRYPVSRLSAIAPRIILITRV